MDRFQQLIRCVLLVLLGASCLPALALTEQRELVWGGGRASVSADADCTYLVGSGGWPGWSFDHATVSGTKPSLTAVCWFRRSDGFIHDEAGTTSTCPNFFAWSSAHGKCERTVSSCPVGQYGDASGICVAPDCASAVASLNASGAALQTSVTTSTTYACFQHCAVSSSLSSHSPNGPTQFLGPYTYAGQTCDGAGTGTPSQSNPYPATPASAPTTPNYCPGSFNGQTMMVPCSSSTSGGSQTSTPVPVSGPAAPGAVPGTTSSQTTTCVGAQCTTTTTTVTTGTDGTATTGTTTETESKDGYCADNPGSPQCKDHESAFGGSCAATTCTGDAIQCQMAREQARRNCELLDANDASARGITAAAAGDKPGDHPGASPSSVPIGSFDQTDLIGGGCPSDQVVAVGGGRFVTLPWSSLCTPAQWLGNVLVAITALACLGIAFRTKGGE